MEEFLNGSRALAGQEPDNAVVRVALRAVLVCQLRHSGAVARALAQNVGRLIGQLTVEQVDVLAEKPPNWSQVSGSTA